ncbi:MAG TPA: hypothetical protein ENK57_05960, partial [Polyangiaceae bacterium]|nr:hypothetical protein [Polyangiaceae bacterium]
MALISEPLALGPVVTSTSAADVYYDRPTQAETAPAARTVEYDQDHLYVRTATFDHAGRARTITLPEDPDFAGGPAPSVGGELTYNSRGLPSSATALIAGVPHTIVESIVYDRDGLVLATQLGDDTDGAGAARTATLSTTTYDLRRRPERFTTTRQVTGLGEGLDGVSLVVDQQVQWDAANNLVGLLDHRDPAEWPAGYQPQTVAIQHDSLYRVTNASYSYSHAGGVTDSQDTGTDWRSSYRESRGADPMRQEPAPMAPGALTGAAQRVVDLTYSWDYLANQTETSDDQASFYERSLGAIVNGDGEVTAGAALRPSALYLATNLDQGTGPQSGWTEVDYGAGGNMVSMTVHAQCADAPGRTCDDASSAGDLDARRDALNDNCACDVEQHYVYRWDELNRLSEARRYDRDASTSGAWTLATRQRYRYDGANQRTVKQTLSQDTATCVDPPAAGVPCERVALYVYPGDFERRGLVSGLTRYQASAELGTESQYIVAGARTVIRSLAPSDPDAYQRDERLVVPLSNLIGTTSAALDIRTGRLVEASTYYPNGARETFLGTSEAAPEPSGFTGKEADEEVGVVYFGERYLVPRLGRWASPDPLHVHAMGGGEALNSFHYVGGNLLAARDPLGLDGVRDHMPEQHFDGS